MAFAKKVVLITGGGSGIGAETAREFAKEDAIIVIIGRNKEALHAVAKECKDLSPSKREPVYISADLSKEEDIATVIEKTVKKFNRIDVLVNNAGIMASGTIETTDLTQYDNIMNTNVRGPYYLTHLAVPHLIKSKGNIVNVSSVTGIRSFPNVLAYCMSKSALDQLTHCTALELGSKDVRVNSVNPGVIVTGLHKKGDHGMSEEEYDLFLEKCKSTHALGRPGDPLEVANAIMFLAGPLASNITGVCLPVDGGRHAMCPR